MSIYSWTTHDFGECHSPCPYCAAEAAECIVCGDPRPDAPRHSTEAPPLSWYGKGPTMEPPLHRYVSRSEPDAEQEDAS